MFVKELRCSACSKRYSGHEMVFRCECSGSLDVIYDYSEIKKVVSWPVLDSRPFSHFRYREFYPITRNENIISMGEGGTPLIKASNLLPEVDLYFKLESVNPTGSFKDRGTSVEISKALDFNAKSVVAASTGNMGASIAAYAAKAGISAEIFIPKNTSPNKRKQIESYGARVILVDGDYKKAEQLAFVQYKNSGEYLMGDYPYRGEGEKSVGFEIADQITCDKIVLPMGNGTLTKGVWKGITEFQRVGLIKKSKIPKLVGVQASRCDPIYKAFVRKEDVITPVRNPSTVAGAIECGDPLDGTEALRALRESKGYSLAVTDKEILSAKKLLAHKEGIYAEESGAVALAAIIKYPEHFESDTVVCVVTGHGLKT